MRGSNNTTESAIKGVRGKMEKKTKIVCTLGPACDSEDILRDMLTSGMNVARMNFSHGSHEEHKARLERFRKVCSELDIPAAAILDTKGPEIRLDLVEEGTELLKGNEFVLSCGPSKTGNSKKCSISYVDLYRQVKEGDRILIDDGKITLTVKGTKGTDIICNVNNSGPISSRKGVNVPGIHLEMEYLSEKDRQDLMFGIDNGFDYVAASFVRTLDDVHKIRNFLDSNGGQEIKIIAKIENPEGVRNFDEILDNVYGIMVARGDMGVEVDFARLPGIQKSFIEKCNCKGKPVITATQMLDSMITEPQPTRAEISDVANAVFDGSSAIMLSGETAAGKYPAETVKAMTKIAKQAEKDKMLSSTGLRQEREKDPSDVSYAIGHAACTVAEDIDAKVLIAVTKSGYTARMMSRFMPSQPIIAVTPDPGTYRCMALLWGVDPVLNRENKDINALINEAADAAVKKEYLKKGDRAVISAGVPLNVAGNTNMIRVEII